MCNYQNITYEKKKKCNYQNITNLISPTARLLPHKFSQVQNSTRVKVHTQKKKKKRKFHALSVRWKMQAASRTPLLRKTRNIFKSISFCSYHDFQKCIMT